MSEIARASVEHIEEVRPIDAAAGESSGGGIGGHANVDGADVDVDVDVEVRVRTQWLRAAREHAFEIGSLCVHFADEARAWPLKAFFTADECCALMLAMLVSIEEATRYDETTNRTHPDVVHDVLAVPPPIDVTQRLVASARARAKN